jgi:hypothetical protein
MAEQPSGIEAAHQAIQAARLIELITPEERDKIAIKGDD